MGEGRAPPATGLIIYRRILVHRFQFFFFNLPHCQALINIHEFPALEYLSSQRRNGAGRERGRKGSWWRWEDTWMERTGVSLESPSPLGVPFPSCSWQDGEGSRPIRRSPNAYYSSSPGGREGMYAVFSALTIARAWKLVTLRPRSSGGSRRPLRCAMKQ